MGPQQNLIRWVIYPISLFKDNSKGQVFVHFPTFSVPQRGEGSFLILGGMIHRVCRLKQVSGF